MAVPGAAARPPLGGLAATRPAEADNAENAAVPSSAGGDLAIFTDPEFGEPCCRGCAHSSGVPVALLWAAAICKDAGEWQPLMEHLES